MISKHNDWRLCDICGHEGLCRAATQEEQDEYAAEDVCQRCDSQDAQADRVKQLEQTLLDLPSDLRELSGSENTAGICAAIEFVNEILYGLKLK